MRNGRRGILFVVAASISACGGASIPGTVSFTLGGTDSSATGQPLISRRSSALTAGDEFIVSPKKAKITFTSIEYRGEGSKGLGDSKLENCTVEYDRTLSSGKSLLDCAFDAPVGDIHEVSLYFEKNIQLLVDDPTLGIYTDPASATGFTTVSPAGGAAYVPYTITIGSGTTRATAIIFNSPVTVEKGSSPKIYLTMDMVHTVQLHVDGGGVNLSEKGNDPVAIFGGLTPGSSLYFSGADSIDGYPVKGVPSLRVFTDAAGNPLYAMIGPQFCGPDGGPKGAHASPPIGAHIGGWLGKDSANVIAFALAGDSNWNTYAAYYTMQAQTTLGQNAYLNCKATTSPPPPADGKTYASGAPEMLNPDSVSTMKLIAK
jgi:hypothetical protein